MPSIKCKCGEKLGYGQIPNPIEWLTISDVDFDGYSGMIDSEDLYKSMKSMLQCPKCGRLWFFDHGFENPPRCYRLEDVD